MSAADTVAYLGPAGTFTEAAALAFQAEPAKLAPYPTNAATLIAVAEGEVGWGVVPVENSVQGAVAATLDTLWQLEGLQIHRTQIMPIRHHLMGFADRLDAIRTVYAHPQALAQCQQWLARNLPEAILVAATSNTSELKRLEGDRQLAAIASERAARVYGVPILARSIADYDNNCTRFWVVSREPSPGGNYTSLAFSAKANVPGALVQPLQVLARAGINMTRIESRPTKKAIGDYVFFIDLEHPDRADLSNVLQELKQIVAVLKVFGSYPLQICTE